VVRLAKLTSRQAACHIQHVDTPTPNPTPDDEDSDDWTDDADDLQAVGSPLDDMDPFVSFAEVSVGDENGALRLCLLLLCGSCS
jgi:hypothetical protein